MFVLNFSLLRAYYSLFLLLSFTIASRIEDFVPPSNPLELQDYFDRLGLQARVNSSGTIVQVADATLLPEQASCTSTVRLSYHTTLCFEA